MMLIYNYGKRGSAIRAVSAVGIYRIILSAFPIINKEGASRPYFDLSGARTRGGPAYRLVNGDILVLTHEPEPPERQPLRNHVLPRDGERLRAGGESFLLGRDTLRARPHRTAEALALEGNAGGLF